MYTETALEGIKNFRRGERSVLIPLSAWVKSRLTRWRAVLCVFVLGYAVFLLFSISSMPIQWDEVSHLNGGMLLLRGNLQAYFASQAFYPPLYDVFTAGFFSIAGISATSARAVSVVFSLLTLYAVYKVVSFYHKKETALLASLFLGIMPGYFWLSSVALIETILIFFCVISTLFFFLWLKTDRTRFLILSGLTLGIGVLAKYQAVIVLPVIFASILFLRRGHLKKKLRHFSILALVATLVVLPWAVLSYQTYTSKMLNTWLYAVDVGNPARQSLYVQGLTEEGLQRFPSWYYAAPKWIQTPIFYIIEITTPYTNVHPISIIFCGLGFTGLIYFAWRRKEDGIYWITWFAVIYVFFYAIPNKQWRYLELVFPALAISAACLMETASAHLKTIFKKEARISEKKYIQIAALVLLASTVVGVAYSIKDTISWASTEAIHIPVQEATQFACSRLSSNQSLMVLCAQNLFSADMVKFYLQTQGKNNAVYQYPLKPVDTYKPNFNISSLVNECRAGNVKYVFMYEYGADVQYFNTTLTLMDVYQELRESGNFGNLPTLSDIENGSTSSEVIFGNSPRQIYVVTFLS